MTDAEASAALKAIIQNELKKLVEASKMPHCLTRDQLEAVQALARIVRQSPDAPQAPEPELNLSLEDLMKALKS